MTPRYKIGDKFKWLDEYDIGDYALITDIKNEKYVYTIYSDNGIRYHRGCEFDIVEEATRLLTPLEQLI